MNKLLISLLSLTGVAGISTGSYFLLRNSSENVKQKENQGTDEQEDGGESGSFSSKPDASPQVDGLSESGGKGDTKETK